MYKLREIKKEDLQKINRWRSDNKLINCLGAPFRYINLDVDCIWYDSYLQNRNTNIRCAIVEIEKEENILGLVSLTNIDYINRSAELHIMVGDKENRGKGIGNFAITEILKHAFNNVNLNRIELQVLESNSYALKLYEKIGFKNEGVKRQSVYKNGEFMNMINMGILKSEFFNKRK